MILTGTETVAVTGAAGFVGQHLVRYLTDKGFNVRAVINQMPLDEELAKHPLVKQYQGSITDETAMSRCLQDTDILFHLATALGNRVISDEQFFKVNQEGTRVLLQAAVKAGVKKVIHYSSAGVYGRSSGYVAQKENGPKNPIDVYERSKLAGENEALTFSEELDVTVLRPGWVYGEGDRRTFKLIKQIQSGLFFIAGSGKIYHSPIYVGDLVAASVAAIEKGDNGEVYNVAFEMVTVEYMVKTIAGILGKNVLPVKIPIGLVYPPAYLLAKMFSVVGKEAPLSPAKLAFFMRGKPLDSTKIVDAFHIDDYTPFTDGVRRAIEWYKKQHWL